MSGRFIRFGRFRFDAERDHLYFDGRPMALGGKAAILLRMLLKARGEIVLKTDLMDAAWPSPDAAISNLTVQIAALRRILGDNRRSPAWIETFHRVGYRFAGAVEFEGPESVAHPYLISRDRPVVALMPIQLSEGASLHPHIVGGFHENLAAELSKLPVLVVKVADCPADAKLPFDVGACDYRIGGRIEIRRGCINVELTIHTRWSPNGLQKVDIADRNLSELFQVQAELARRTAALLTKALPGETVPDGCSIGELARRHYDRGCELLVRSHAGNRAARLHLSEAVKLDPGFAKAHAFLGIGHFTAAMHYGEDIHANRALAVAYANKAVSLAPAHSTARSALGFVQLYEGQLPKAEDSLLAARCYDSSDTYALINLAELRVFQGRHDNAVSLARKAIRESANPPGWYFWILAFGQYAAGRYSQAVESLTRPGIEMFPGKRILAASLAQLGHLKEAKEEANRFHAMHPGFRISGWSETQPFVVGGDRRHFIDGFTKAGLPG